MKKVLFILAVATLFFFSCQKEVSKPQENHDSITVKASIENYQSATKADLSDSDQFLWASGDKIGLYSSGDKVRNPFILAGAGGSSSGQFDYAGEGSFERTDVTGAYFPWEDNPGEGKNNIWEGTFYITLPQDYYNYTSKKMLTPLAASVEYNNGYDIDFKHVGAAVKLIISDIPAGSNSIGLIADQQIWGSYRFDIADIANLSDPDVAMVVNTANSANNSIWLHYDPESTGEFVFVFPVPPLTAPKLTFCMWDENGIKVWEKRLKAQPEDLKRKELLVLTAPAIVPYPQFNKLSSEWTVSGDNNSWGDTPMVTDGNLCIAKGVKFDSDGAFKIRKNGAWTESYGDYNNPDGPNNFAVSAGTYDIIFDPSGTYTSSENTKVRVVASKCPYPTVNNYSRGLQDFDLLSSNDITWDE